jgi:hypothetical protein
VADGDRALRKMIAELAEMPAQSCSAVLSKLDEAQRDRVGALLDEYRGDAPPAPVAIDARGLPPGLSPWLVELLGDAVGGAARSDAEVLTPATFAALRACAAELTKVPASPVRTKGMWRAIADRVLSLRSAAGVS